jgi:CRP/FNR family transcriptional regulator
MIGRCVASRPERSEAGLRKMAVLDAFSFFRDATAEVRSAVESAGHPLALPSGAIVFRDGDRCDQFTLVGRGGLRVFKTAPTGREITLYHVQPGEICLMNSLSVFLETPVRATAVVEAPLEALAFPRPVFLEWLRTNDAVRSFVFGAMAERVFDVMTLVEEIAFGKMDVRLAHLLSRRFANNGLPLREISTTHEEVAAELGTVREVVSRLLKEFERLGALETLRGRILLRDEDVLRQLGQPPASGREQDAPNRPR